MLSEKCNIKGFYFNGINSNVTLQNQPKAISISYFFGFLTTQFPCFNDGIKRKMVSLNGDINPDSTGERQGASYPSDYEKRDKEEDVEIQRLLVQCRQLIWRKVMS